MIWRVQKKVYIRCVSKTKLEEMKPNSTANPSWPKNPQYIPTQQFSEMYEVKIKRHLLMHLCSSNKATIHLRLKNRHTTPELAPKEPIHSNTHSQTPHYTLTHHQSTNNLPQPNSPTWHQPPSTSSSAPSYPHHKSPAPHYPSTTSPNS